MRFRGKNVPNDVVGLSALDMFANAVGALAFMLLLFAANAMEMVRPSTLRVITRRLPAARVGTDYIGVISALGGVPGYRWTITQGQLPSGLELDGNRGEIVGTPVRSTEAGATCRFEVTDSRNKRASEKLEVRVLPESDRTSDPRKPVEVLTHGQLPPATAGEPYALYLSARGGSAIYQWDVRGLPEGLILDSKTGLLHGVPSEEGTRELLLTVTDRAEGRGDASQSKASAWLVTRRANLKASSSTNSVPDLRILTETVPSALANREYKATLAGQGAPPLRWQGDSLPVGLNVTERGVLQGLPTETGRTEIVVALTDAFGHKAARRIHLMVEPAMQQVSPDAEVPARGLWRWLGFLILALSYVAVLYVLRRRFGTRVHELLALHGVELIEKPDGTTGLNGPPDKVELFRNQFRSNHVFSARVSRIVLAIHIVCAILYTIFLLSL